MASVNKKPQAGILIVNESHYRLGIMFCFGVDDKQIRAKIKKYGMEGFDNLGYEKPYAGLTIHNNANSFIVRMPEWPTRASHYNTLSHEIFHVCDLALRGSGFRLNEGSHEAWAYLIGNVTEALYQKLWDKKYH